MVTVLPINTIVSDPNVKNGQPTIAGRSLRVIDVVGSYLYHGLTPEELAINYALSLGDVHAVLAYYYHHKQEVDRMLHEDEAEAMKLITELEAQGKLIRIE